MNGAYVRCGDKGCVRLGMLAKLVKGKGVGLGEGMEAKLGKWVDPMLGVDIRVVSDWECWLS